ncbi:rhodanese-related sulfurtransferase [Anaerotaenia torta]|uniref:rhodanese-like domain-containing protein n=1 Tax=Anaerotaenia torta TaxID=433293 RepID=UPI003D24EE47
MFSLFQRSNTNSLHVSEIDNIIEDIDLIDIREPYECAYGCIRQSKNIPMGALMSNPDRYLNKEKKYYIMCQSGGRSASAVSALSRAGYDVVDVRGGMSGYRGKNRK